MTITELMYKNDTAFNLCHDLANRKRRRPEPIKISRYARRIRQKVQAMGFNTFSATDFTEALKDLEHLKWGKLIPNAKGTYTHFKFTKDMLTFGAEIPDSHLVLTAKLKEPVALETKRPLTPIKAAEVFRLVFVLPSSKVTMQVETRDLKEAIKGLTSALQNGVDV